MGGGGRLHWDHVTPVYLSDKMGLGDEGGRVFPDEDKHWLAQTI